jgi:phosphoglycolate phosphatase
MSDFSLLLDLDGTLLDTAPDMAAALNRLRHEEGLPQLPLETIRPRVSRGGLALTRLAFADHRDEAEIEALRQRFLRHYLDAIAVHSQLFEGFEALFETLEDHGVAWGVVTNKPAWLTDPLMAELGLDRRSAVTVSGDSTPERKPHPLPLLTAAERIGIDAGRCWYVGDDPRDIEAGNAAGMTTVIAGWGYIDDNARLDDWGADHRLYSPSELQQLLPL